MQRGIWNLEEGVLLGGYSFPPFKRGEFEMCLHVGKGGKKTDNSSHFTYITSFNMMSVFTHEVIEA